MKTVYLHGRLGKRFGKKWELAADSAIEVFSAIEANSEGFLSYLIKTEKEGVDYCVFLKNPSKISSKKELRDSVLSEEDLSLNKKNSELHIVPSPRGGMPPAFGIFALWSGAIGTKAFKLTLLGKIVVAVAISFIVGAIMKSLFKPPKRGEPTTTKSYLMQGSQNRTAQGVAVPVGYGTLKIGSTNIGQDKVTHRLRRQGGDKAAERLESYSSVEYLELLSEGPIGGVVSSDGVILGNDIREGVFLNSVPIKNPSNDADGSLNFILNEDGDIPQLQKGESSSSLILCESSALTAEYGTVMYGGGPYVSNPDSEIHRESFAEAVRGSIGAKIVTHFVANEFVSRVRLTLAAVVSHQNDDGTTSPEEARFAVHILRDNREFNVLDPAAGCIVTKNESPGSSGSPIIYSESAYGLTKGASGLFFSVKGICSDNYEFDVIIDFASPQIKSKGTTFKIVKLTNELDPTVKGTLGGLGKSRRLTFVSATDYVREDLRYPHSAIAKIKFDSKNFNSIPQRSYLLKMKRVLVPSNYNPETRKYDGPWDGLFHGQHDSTISVHSIDDKYLKWTDNPAWVYYDLVSNARFGISKFGLDEESIDKWQLYRIAKYCDELVETNYPIENDDEIPRVFSSDNTLDLDGNFTIKIEDSQYYIDSSNVYVSSPGRITSQKFESEFGDSDRFKGRKVAFFMSTHSVSAESENRRKKSALREGEILIEERVIVRSSESSRTVTLKGPAFPDSLEFTDPSTTQTTVIGACVAQINHPVVEPRFTSNIYLTDRMKALDIINNFASVFRGITTYYNGKIVAIQDSFKNPVALFTNSNVTSDGFNYSGISKDQKITTAMVRFNNKDNNFRQDLVSEEDPEAAQKFGYREEETMGFGITSESQARRLAKWMLFTTQIEIETVSFTSGPEAGYLFPGAIFEISDEARAGRTKSGRILRIGQNQKRYVVGQEDPITVDQPYFLLDKNLIDEPFKNEPEITVCVGMSNASEENISLRAPFERRAEDQDAEIESIFTPQVLRFACDIVQGGKFIEKGPQGQNVIATNLSLKSSFIVDVGKNLFKIFNHVFEDGDLISFVSDGRLPRGLEYGSNYYIINSTKHTFQVSVGPGGSSLEIQDEGEDRLGNPSGQHFILSESYSSQTQDALDRISVGSTWSMKGRVAGKGKVPVTQSLPTKQYLQLTKDLASGSANWSLSEYLGYLYIDALDWLFSATLGWIYKPPPSDNTWLWFKNIQQWVWIKPLGSGEQKRNWWYINNIDKWLYVKFTGDNPTHAFFYGNQTVNVGETIKIGELKSIASGTDSNITGNWFAFNPDFEFPTQSSAPQKESEPNLLDKVVGLDSFTEVVILTDGIEAVLPEGSVQRAASVRISLDPQRDSSIPVDDGEFVFITGTNFSMINNSDSPVKLVRVDDNTFEINNSSALAGLIGSSVYGGGKISFLTNNVERADGFLNGQLFKTMTTKELDGGAYEVTGLEYVPAKFGAIDKKTKVIRPRLPIPPQANMDIPDGPTDLILTDLTI